MKKFKLLPSMLMLFLCIGVLVVGIYAISPATNEITGQISVKSAGPSITINAYVDSVAEGNELIASPITVRNGAPIVLDNSKLSMNAENENDPTNVYKKIIIQIRNNSNKNLGAYFWNGVTDGAFDTVTSPSTGDEIQVVNANGMEELSQILQKDVNGTTTHFVKVILSSYSYIEAKNDDNENDVIQMEIFITLQNFFDMDTSLDLNYSLCIEEYVPNITDEEISTGQGKSSNFLGILVDTASSINVGNGLLKMPFEYTLLDSNNTVANCYSPLLGNTAIKYVVIPTSISEVETCFAYSSSVVGAFFGGVTVSQYAFSGCSSLTSVMFSNATNVIYGMSGKSFGTIGAFSGCTSLTSIVFPDSITEISGNYNFRGCTSLKSVVAGAGLIALGSYTFGGCSSLKEIKFGQNLKTIGEFAFSDCTNLTEITIPASVESIGARIVGGCTSLNQITVEEGNATYHSSGNCIIETASKTLIAGCSNSVIPTSDSVTSIGDYAFYKVIGLISINILENIISIGNYAFYGCSGLKEIILSGQLTSIGNYAFQNCASITTITIPSSLTTLGTYAFSNCDALVSVFFETGLTAVSENVFYDCDALSSVSFSSSITSIGASAFKSCDALESITITTNITQIGKNAFNGCANLTNAKFEYPQLWYYMVQTDSSYSLNEIIYTDLEVETTAATYLTTTYCGYEWTRVTITG